MNSRLFNPDSKPWSFFGQNTAGETKLDDGMAVVNLTDSGNNRALLNMSQ
jgi:hypothetical protein